MAMEIGRLVAFVVVETPSTKESIEGNEDDGGQKKKHQEAITKGKTREKKRKNHFFLSCSCWILRKRWSA